MRTLTQLSYLGHIGPYLSVGLRCHVKSSIAWRCASTSTSVPRLASHSIWDSVIPKLLKDHSRTYQPAGIRTSREWNPATFFIIIFLIIGSNAVQMIALRNNVQMMSRKTEARIALLREAIEHVHRGEEVDVKKMLGTGDIVQEKEWEEVMRELESASVGLFDKSEDTEKNAQKTTKTLPSRQVHEQRPAHSVQGPEVGAGPNKTMNDTVTHSNLDKQTVRFF